MSRREFTEGEVQTLREMWLSGVSPTAIGHRLGRTDKNIHNKAKRLGLPGRAKMVPPSGPMTLEDLEYMPLPRSQRLVMAAVLEAYPVSLTHKEIGERAFGDDLSIVNPAANASLICRRLDEKLRAVGWRCSTTGDRRGVKLYPVVGEMA